MHFNSITCVFLLGLCSCGLLHHVSACKHEPETPDWRMTLKTIRNGIHKIDKYLNAALDLFGGDDGLCHYRCSDGEPLFSFTDKFSSQQLILYVTDNTNGGCVSFPAGLCQGHDSYMCFSSSAISSESEKPGDKLDECRV